jgi:hypothetical protein
MPATIHAAARRPINWPLRTLGFLLYLAAASGGLLEIALRAGLLDTEPYRERQRIATQLTGRPVVLVLGDSFSLEANRSVVERLREEFAARGLDTLNLATMGEGPGYYLDRLRQFGDTARPRLVLVNYFAGNDLTDTAYAMAGPGRAKRLAKRLMARSFAAHAVVTAVQSVRLRQRLATIEGGKDFGRPGVERITNPFLFEVAREHPDFLLDNVLMKSPAARRAWAMNTQYLLEMKRLADGWGAGFVVNVFPPDVQVQPTHFRFYRTLGIHTEPDFLETNSPQASMRRFCDDHGLDCFDLLPVLRAASDRELYLHQDTHWNAEGNRIAFEAVRAHLSPRLPSLTARR